MKDLLPFLFVPLALFAFQDKAAQDQVETNWQKKLAPIAGFDGEHRGQGRSRMGGYQERWHGEWINGKTAFQLRTESRQGQMTVFQDVRVFTWDKTQKRIRCRQFARGGVCTYDVEVKGDGTLVLHEKEAEGLDRGEWRYTISFGKG